jgi:uncharacterized repeat protein (TIGR03806 family)
MFALRRGIVYGAIFVGAACAGSGTGPPPPGTAPDAAVAPDSVRAADAATAGLTTRPRNTSCFAPARVPEVGVEGLPARLSQTGCFDPADPTRPAPALIPFEVNAPLWSDGATKERWLALPDGARVAIEPDGDFHLPPGAVLIKTFTLDGRRVETRFFVRLSSGTWGGYTYEWNEGGTDAVVLDEGSRRRRVGNRDWHYPTRAECLQCHTPAAGSSLGLEIAQLNGDFAYPGGRRANQLATWEHIGLFDASLPDRIDRLPAVPVPGDARGPLEARARAYLHANCSNCHRPGVDNSGSTDFRYSTTLAETRTCGVEPRRDTLGAPVDSQVIAAGHPEKSMVVVRMLELGRGRMPEVASLIVDREGVALISDWIRSLTACP